MSILSSELKKYCSANRPEDDVAAGGGAIDLTCILDVIQMAANDTLQMVSDNVGDTTQSVTVKGRNAAGAIITDTKTLNGTTPVAFTGTFERFLSVSMGATAVGNVTVERVTGGADIVVMPAGVTDAIVQFIDAASEAGATTRYAKEFWRNESAESLTLTAAKVQLTADPSSVIRVGVHTAKDDTATITNRKTAPGGITFVDDSVQQNVPTNELALNEEIGLWIELQLGAGAAALKSSFTTELAGSST